MIIKRIYVCSSSASATCLSEAAQLNRQVQTASKGSAFSMVWITLDELPRFREQKTISIYCACNLTKLTILKSLGSAATRLRCGGQCNKHFVANLLPNLTVKKSWKWWQFAKVIGKSIQVPFWLTVYTCVYMSASVTNHYGYVRRQWGWWTVRHHLKDVWKSIMAVDGELCVTTVSATSTLESLVTVLAMGKSV